MITINAQALAKSMKRLKDVKADISKNADKAFRQKVFNLATMAVRVSPQFSGEFASNWNLAVDGNMPVFKPWAHKYALENQTTMRDNGDGTYSYRNWAGAHQAGDPEAVTSSMARIAGQLARVTRHSKVHLVNATELFTDGTRMIGPDGVEQLRAENIIPGRVRIERYVMARAAELRGKV